MGAMTSISSLSFVVGAIVGNSILGAVSVLPASDFRMGASFFFTATLNLVAFALLLRRRGRVTAVAS